PDLARNDRAGAHPYSSSAIGYRGLVELLELRGDDVSISRVVQRIEQYDRGLMILTPGWRDEALDEDLYLEEPALIILPKWWGVTDRENRRWQSEIDLRSPTNNAASLIQYDPDVSVEHIKAPSRIRTPDGIFEPRIYEKLQVIISDEFTSIISAPRGQLLSVIPGTEIYVLSDPDLANTFGLAEPHNAAMMLGILDYIRQGDDTPIVFDATMHGFERSASLLKALLDVPFIGATLTALAAMLLLGWTALVRFGSPIREDRAIALGKEALTDNTAGLFAMTRRETRMAPGYLALSRKAAARDLGAPRGLSEPELAELFDRMSEGGQSGESWSEIATGLRSTTITRDDLLDRAQRIWRWRKERSDGIK
ncbi:MAG: hypothetical protein AAGF33_16320, partial [Pseudomonadota bacterium]